MTNNWIEEFKKKFDGDDWEDTFIEHYGCSPDGDSYDIDKIINFITTLLEKQREEDNKIYIKMIEKLYVKVNYEKDKAHNKAIDEVINLIKSHDKTS